MSSVGMFSNDSFLPQGGEQIVSATGSSDRKVSAPTVEAINLFHNYFCMDNINLSNSYNYFQPKKKKKKKKKKRKGKWDSSASFRCSDSMDCYALYSPTRLHSIHH